jgi:hypothetical protein
LAFLGAPLIVPFVFYIPFPGESAGTAHFSWLALLSPLIFAPYALAISYIAEFLLGVPAWVVFRRYGIRSLPAFAAGGAFMGWLVNLGMGALAGNLTTKPLTTMFNILNDPYISICIVAGASSAVLFRTIVFGGSKGAENPK